jgi:putative peptidoglycan lipid II flippase
MDAYVAAMALPVVVATILSGSLGYVLVPAVAERLAGGNERDAATVASQVGLYMTAASLLISAAVTASAGPLTAFLCPGFSADERALTAGLLRVLSALIVANSLASYLNALFHSYRRFAEPAVAGVIGTLATLGYVLLLHQQQGIFAVAWGVVFGATVTVAILLPLFLSQLWSSAAWKAPMHAGTRQCFGLLMPLVLGAIYWRLDPLVDRFLGSYLPLGSIAHIGYAWRLISGLMLIGTSGLSIVAFPAIAAHAAAKKHDDLNVELAHAIRFFLFLIVPVCVGLAAFRVPVVRLLFEHGRFTSADTQAVSLLVALYVGVIFGAGLGDLLSRTCYAQHDTRTPVIVHSLNFTLAAGLKFLIVGSSGAAGLVTATSMYYLLNSTVLGTVLLRRLGRDMLTGTPGTLLRSLASSIVACLAASLIIRLPAVWAVLPAAACGAVVYLLMMLLFADDFALKLCRRLTGWAG